MVPAAVRGDCPSGSGHERVSRRTGQEVLAAFEPGAHGVQRSLHRIRPAAPARQEWRPVKRAELLHRAGVAASTVKAGGPWAAAIGISPLNTELIEEERIWHLPRVMQAVEPDGRTGAPGPTTVEQGVADAFITAYLHHSRERGQGVDGPVGRGPGDPAMANPDPRSVLC